MGENKHKQAIDTVTRKWAILAGLCTSPIFIFFVCLGDSGRGMAAWVSAVAISTAARFLWDLKDKVWYWATIVVIVLLHAPLIFLLPWPLKRWSYVQLLPIGIMDFSVAYGIIRLVEKLANGNDKRDFTA